MRGSVTHHAGSPRTSNTGLAAALTAVGIPLAEKPFLQVMEDGCRERTIWLFEAQSEDGKHDTRQLIAAWDDASWHLAQGTRRTSG